MLSRPHSPAAEQAGTGEATASFAHQPVGCLCCRGGCLLRVGRWCCSAGREMVLLCVGKWYCSADREMVLLCRSGDRIALLGAVVSQRDAQPHSSHEAGSVPPRVLCSLALGWGRVFPEREMGDGK